MSQLAAQRANAEALVKKIVTALDDKKASDIRVIDITGKTSVADYLVIATGLADQHLRGMRIEIEKTLDEAGVQINGVESQDGSGWTVMGTFEVMIHLFRADQRAAYKIEQLWNEGTEIPVARFITPVAKPAGFVDVTGNSKTVVKKPASKAAAKQHTEKGPVVKKEIIAKLFATRTDKPKPEKKGGRRGTAEKAKLKAKAAAEVSGEIRTKKAPVKKDVVRFDAPVKLKPSAVGAPVFKQGPRQKPVTAAALAKKKAAAAKMAEAAQAPVKALKAAAKTPAKKAPVKTPAAAAKMPATAATKAAKKPAAKKLTGKGKATAVAKFIPKAGVVTRPGKK